MILWQSRPHLRCLAPCPVQRSSRSHSLFLGAAAPTPATFLIMGCAEVSGIFLRVCCPDCDTSYLVCCHTRRTKWASNKGLCVTCMMPFYSRGPARKTLIFGSCRHCGRLLSPGRRNSLHRLPVSRLRFHNIKVCQAQQVLLAVQTYRSTKSHQHQQGPSPGLDRMRRPRHAALCTLSGNNACILTFLQLMLRCLFQALCNLIFSDIMSVHVENIAGLLHFQCASN